MLIALPESDELPSNFTKMKFKIKYFTVLLRCWLLLEVSHQIYLAARYLSHANFNYEEYVLNRNVAVLNRLAAALKKNIVNDFYYDIDFNDTQNLTALPPGIRRDLLKLRYDLTNNETNFFLLIQNEANTYDITIVGGNHFLRAPNSLEFDLRITNDRSGILKMRKMGYVNVKDDFYVRKIKRKPSLIFYYNDERLNLLIYYLLDVFRGYFMK